jgi:peptidoglycan/LPS O-acetylase OafA/YrhL
MTVTEIASVVIIAYFLVHPRGIGTKFVGLSVLVLLGNMSYTIYLLHWPVFVALTPTTTHVTPWALDVIRMTIVIALAGASWYLMEGPLTRWRRRQLAPVEVKES